jgi:pyrroline-5-carboxylate reductase
MKNTLGFIGLGNMGTALLKGFTASPESKKIKIFAFDTDTSKQALMKPHKAKWLNNGLEVVEKTKYVVLAIKPQDVGKFLGKIKSSIHPETVLISLCAGFSADRIRSLMFPDVKIVQVMPNTPMKLGMGASAIAFSDNLSGDEKKFVHSLIGSCSIVKEVIPAMKMNEITCINGSSPAFIFLFAKCFVDYAWEQGLDGDAALRLFAGTLKGSATMLTDSKLSIDELISQVGTPGGTTNAAMDVLKEQKFYDIVKAACDACTIRANELGFTE